MKPLRISSFPAGQRDWRKRRWKAIPSNGKPWRGTWTRSFNLCILMQKTRTRILRLAHCNKAKKAAQPRTNGHSPRAVKPCGIFCCDPDCKPGSVFDSHLSRRIVADALKPPPRRRSGRPYVSSTVLLRIEFTAPQCSHAAGELLPRLSTLTPPKRGGISLLHFS